MFCLQLFDSSDSHYILIPDRDYTVGRLDCCLNFPNDRSVSRQHCTLKLVKNNQSDEQTHGCSVTDSGSRFGTLVGDNQIKSGQMVAQVGTRIRFGAGQSMATFVYDTLRVYPASTEILSKINSSRLIASLNATVVSNALNAYYFITEVVDETLIQSADFMATLVRAKRVVTFKYFEELATAREEATRSLVLQETPDFRQFLPIFAGRLASIAENECDMDLSQTRRGNALFTRRALRPDDRRATLFDKATFYFTNGTTLRRYQSVLEPAGAACRNLFESRYRDSALNDIVDPSARLVLDNDAVPLGHLDEELLTRVLSALRGVRARTIASVEIFFAILLSDTQVFTNSRASESHETLKACAAFLPQPSATASLSSTQLRSAKRKADAAADKSLADEETDIDSDVEIRSPEIKRIRTVESHKSAVASSSSTQLPVFSSVAPQAKETDGLDQRSPLLISRKRAAARNSTANASRGRSQASTADRGTVGSTSLMQSWLSTGQPDNSRSTANADATVDQTEDVKPTLPLNREHSWLSGKSSTGTSVPNAAAPSTGNKSQSFRQQRGVSDISNTSISEQLSYSRAMHILNESTGFIASKCAPNSGNRLPVIEEASTLPAAAEGVTTAPQPQLNENTDQQVKTEVKIGECELPEALVEHIEIDFTSINTIGTGYDRSVTSALGDMQVSVVNFKRFRKVWPADYASVSVSSISVQPVASTAVETAGVASNFRYVDVYAGDNDDAQLLAEFAEAESAIKRRKQNEDDTTQKSESAVNETSINRTAVMQSEEEKDDDVVIISSQASSRASSTKATTADSEMRKKSGARASSRRDTTRQSRPGAFDWFENQLSM